MSNTSARRLMNLYADAMAQTEFLPVVVIAVHPRTNEVTLVHMKGLQEGLTRAQKQLFLAAATYQLQEAFDDGPAQG